MIVSGNLGWLHKGVQVYTHNLIAPFLFIYWPQELKIVQDNIKMPNEDSPWKELISFTFSQVFLRTAQRYRDLDKPLRREPG